MTDTVTNISVTGLNFIRSQEGRALRAYQDAAHVWTIGYGITNMDKGIGFVVKAGATITADQAESLLYSSLQHNYMPDCRRAFNPNATPHPQGAFDAAVSFHYNTGAIRRATWPKDLVAHNLARAKTSLSSWNHAAGRVLTGLVRRRAAEWNMTQGIYGHVTGPAVLNGNRIVGTGTVLTSLPDQAGEVKPGKVAVNGPPPAHFPGPVIGLDIHALQTDLATLGYAVAPTGEYDDATEEAVSQFQGTHPNLTVDGRAGPATDAAITRALDLRKKGGKLAKTIPVGALAAGGVWQFVSHDVGVIAAAVAGVLILGLGAKLAWQYRAEISAKFNQMTGRTVV